MLFTQATPAEPDQYHGSVVIDRNTPLAADATPLFANVWSYMCFSQIEAPRRRAVSR